MPKLNDKMAFSANAGISVKYGVKAGLATKFPENKLEWLVFV